MNRIAPCLVLLGLAVCTCPPSASAQFIEDISFQRLEFQFDDKDPIPLSHFARCLVVYAPGPESAVLNVAARLPLGDPVWIVRNLPLAPDTLAQPQETVGFRFPLLLLGVDLGEPLVGFDIDYTVTPTLLFDDDAPAWMAGLGFPHPITLGSEVIDAQGDELTGNVTAADPIPLLPYFPLYPTGSGSMVTHSHIGCAMPNVDLNRMINSGDRNGCVPAAHANSMRWLDDTYSAVFFPRTLRETYDDISLLMYRKPTNYTYWPKMLKGTLDFIEAYELPVKVEYQHYEKIASYFSKSRRTYAASQHTGPAEDWPDWQWLQDETVAGADVTIGVGYYIDDNGDDERKGGHVVVLTGTFTYGLVHYFYYKHDAKQGYPLGTIEELACIIYDSEGAMVAVGMGGTTWDDNNNEIPYFAKIEKVMSKRHETGAVNIPHVHTFHAYGDQFMRTVPAGYAISVTWPVDDYRCFNTFLYLWDRTDGEGHGDCFDAWNYNSGDTKTWVNDTGRAMTFIIKNTDTGGPFDISYTLGDGTGMVTTPGNPWDYGGFSLGWHDGSAEEFGSPDGPVVVVMPGAGLSLDEFPSVMDPGGVSTLHIDYHIDEWHETWAELGLSLWVAEVLVPGPLFIDCPATGYVGDLEITEAGLYELDLGTMLAPGPQLFHLTLETTLGAAFSIDCLGVPSTAPVSAVPDRAAAPPVPVLETGYPNPFNAGTTIRFFLPRAEYAELAVFDLQGRLVKTLCAGSLPAGPHDEIWRGRDNRGQSVASSVYVCRLKTGSGTMSTKLTFEK